jgi:hypothetical protein
MSDRDVAIGQNLIRLRGEKSQQDVADAMRAAGYKWSQATVWAVEKGDRPLRLAEAESLAEVLGTRIDNFTRTESFVRLEIARSHMYESFERLKADINDFYDRQFFLAVVAEGVDISETMRDMIEDWLRMTPEQIAATVRTARDGEAAAERMQHAAALGFESVADLDSSGRDTSETGRTDENNPFMKLFWEAYSGEHQEEA